MKETINPLRHQSLITASDENFDERQYLAANPDLRTARERDANFDVAAHFVRYGKAEGRKQFNAPTANAAASKFRKFRAILDLSGSRHAARAGTFPILYGDGHHALTAYDGESANPAIPEWTRLLEADPRGYFVDLGCGFRDVVYSNCLYVEVYPSLSVRPGTR